MKFNEQLDKLFNDWEKYTDSDKFCKDGLVMKYGEPKDSVDEKWEKAERRVAFILKDNPDGWTTDLRTWLSVGENYEHNRNLCGGRVGQTGFLPNIARMFYGLYENPCIGFADINMAEVKKVWNEAPFALIESKKIAGTTTVSDQEIIKAIETNRDFLQKELDILHPNIIVCCDPSMTIFHFVTDYYMSQNGNENDIIKHEYQYVLEDKVIPNMICCAWYLRNINVLVILSYHPTRLGKSNWKIYERVVSPLRTFPQKEDLKFKPLNKD